jgi:hypothetical protein
MVPVIILFLTNFLKTLFIILIIFYGFKLVSKYLFPFFLHRTVKNMQSKMEEQIRQQQRSGKQEGEVTVERNSKNGSARFNEGEYIDFEEVE